MQHQETPLKLWTVDSNKSQILAKPISDDDAYAANATTHTDVTANKAVSTNFNPLSLPLELEL